MARTEVGAARRRRFSLFARIAGGVVIALLIAATIGVAAGVAWLKGAMQKQMPVLDGALRVPGLSAPVVVRRDGHGVPHIQAANMEDLLEAQGYVVAQDRLWQMDMARRFASGELAELLGPSVVEHDKLQRILQIRPAAEHLTATMPEDQKRLFEAFARGVNAFINSHQDNLPAEFRLLDYKPRPWQPVDSWLVALNMVARLDTLYPWKLEREKVEAKLPPNLIAELYPTSTFRDHPPTQSAPDLTAPQGNIPDAGQDEPQSSLEDLLHLRAILNLASDNCENCKPGSNEWAVSGTRTASGKPMLSNDMHLEHSIPDIWHEEDLQAGSFHVAGVTTPGIPLIIEGHNQHVAWGFTTLNGDVQDVYVEKTNGQGEYWTANGWRQPEHDQEHIHVRFGQDVLLDVEITDHGPVITPLLPHETRMLSLKWTLYASDLHGLPLLGMDSASNWTEFRQATSEWWGPTQNVAYADDQGHIGYQAVGLFPIRPAGLSGVPIVETGTASDKEHEWQGWIPFEQLPTVFDPDSGIVATANARITPDGYPYPLALNWDAPYRNERIWKWLSARTKLTPADMLKLQTDTYSEVDRELAQRFAYAIDRSTAPDATLHQAADILRIWDGVITKDSVAAEIVDATRQALWPLVLEPKLGADWRLYSWQSKNFVQEEMVEKAAPEWLPAKYKSWDDLIAAAIRKGMADKHAPSSLRDWTFGSQHILNVKHPLYGMLPFFGWTSTGPHELAGDETTVDHVRGILGASQRLTVDWSNVDGSTENIVMGESGDPVSPYYLDQFPYWYAGKTFPMPFTEAAVSASTQNTLRLLP
ncbi:MAG TPA: penicillin acylase family protein [Acidobacteriaceae bacterium]|nr:penicillin acylase family protein [Acidobacteriaceae bacterium]